MLSIDYSLRLVEGILKDFPRIVEEKEFLDRLLESSAVGGGGENGIRVLGGQKLFQQDKYVDKTESGYYRLLEKIISAIREAYNDLDDKSKQIVDLCCFRGYSNNDAAEMLYITPRHLQRVKRKAYLKLKSQCLTVIEDVEKWRDHKIYYSRTGMQKIGIFSNEDDQEE